MGEHGEGELYNGGAEGQSGPKGVTVGLAVETDELWVQATLRLLKNLAK